MNHSKSTPALTLESIPNKEQLELLGVHSRNCNNLYALKSAHWRLVIPRENQLQKLKRESVVVDEDGSVSYGGNETIVKQIEAELLEDYKRYQDLLEHIRVINDPYTQLAFLIMRADAAWYTAKVTKDAVDRRRQYSLAKKRYSELLEKGTVALTSNDTSLLKILEKLCTVLAEYPDQQDSQLKNFCWQTLQNAEAG
uniref:14-3-3 domain-containing protein n=1 Tax=Parascaris univalens TaxID=6257 RepID=A0A915B7L3_PARUN